MIHPFRRLPGFTRTVPGRERTILRNLPRAFLLGSLALALPSLLVRLIENGEGSLLATSIDIYVVSLIVLHWTAVLTIAIAAFIVMVMKGPAYVADAYPLQESDKPD